MTAIDRRDLFKAGLALLTLPPLSGFLGAQAPKKESPLDQFNTGIDSKKFYPGIERAEIRVTSLKGEGEGSLREALTKGPGVIVFDVAGTIDLKGIPLVIGSNVTISAEDAPEGGISIVGGEVRVKDATNVRLSHLDIRSGPDVPFEPKEVPDGLCISGTSTNVLVKNCTIMMGMDENASTTSKIADGKEGAPKNILFEECIIADSLNKSRHPKSPHGCGFLAFNFSHVEFKRCLFANNENRNPQIKPDATVKIEDCVISNCGEQAIQIQYDQGEVAKYKNGAPRPPAVAIVRTVMVRGPNTNPETSFVESHKAPPNYIPTVYVSKLAEVVLAPATPGARIRAVAANKFSSKGVIKYEPFDPKDKFLIPMNVTEATSLLNQVLTNAGARPGSRDAYTKNLIEEVRTNKGTIKNDPTVVPPPPVKKGPMKTDPKPAPKKVDPKGAVEMKKDEKRKSLPEGAAARIKHLEGCQAEALKPKAR